MQEPPRPSDLLNLLSALDAYLHDIGKGIGTWYGVQQVPILAGTRPQSTFKLHAQKEPSRRQVAVSPDSTIDVCSFGTMRAAIHRLGRCIHLPFLRLLFFSLSTISRLLRERNYRRWRRDGCSPRYSGPSSLSAWLAPLLWLARTNRYRLSSVSQSLSLRRC
ncbi:hypothetical protein LZ31DRAFT_21897 [Colletotrichum somersetense]|nr:hypothetical protein LZ31DRAFT_21897 [Colletotrichum somersetense]